MLPEGLEGICSLFWLLMFGGRARRAAVTIGSLAPFARHRRMIAHIFCCLLSLIRFSWLELVVGLTLLRVCRLIERVVLGWLQLMQRQRRNIISHLCRDLYLFSGWLVSTGALRCFLLRHHFLYGAFHIPLTKSLELGILLVEFVEFADENFELLVVVLAAGDELADFAP